MATLKLLDDCYNVVAELTIPDNEVPDVIVYEGRTFCLDVDHDGQFIETQPLVVGSARD